MNLNVSFIMCNIQILKLIINGALYLPVHGFTFLTSKATSTIQSPFDKGSSFMLKTLFRSCKREQWEALASLVSKEALASFVIRVACISYFVSSTLNLAYLIVIQTDNVFCNKTKHRSSF